MTGTQLLQLGVAAACVNNILISRMLGFESVLETARDVRKTAWVGVLVAVCMTIGGAVAWPLDRLVTVSLHAPWASTLTLVMALIGTCMLVESALPLLNARAHAALGTPFRLVTANCAILGIALINTGVNPATGRPFSYIEAMVNAAASGIGFLAASVLIAAACERMERSAIPAALRGAPITLITAGLLGMAIAGFGGMVVKP